MNANENGYLLTFDPFNFPDELGTTFSLIIVFELFNYFNLKAI